MIQPPWQICWPGGSIDVMGQPTAENTYVGKKGRQCRACGRDRMRKRRQQARESA